jgi:hypothetical protein
VAEVLRSGEPLAAGSTCLVCGRHLADAESVQRGVGSECWGAVIDLVQNSKSQRTT